MGGLQEEGSLKAWPLAIAAVSAALCAGWQAPSLSNDLSAKANRGNLDVHESHASASLLGQVRTDLSSWLWLKADLYLHNGVEMRPLTDDEKRRGTRVQGAANDGREQLFKEQDVTVVPSQADDFRGWFGDVERSTTAYKDMANHQHNDPTAALPLFRLMTWVDPQFIPAWTTGATIMARSLNKQGTYQALNFLEDGLTANPDDIELLTEIGYFQATRRKDLRTAVTFLERARTQGRLHVRSHDEEERDALEQTYRWLALCYRDMGDEPNLRDVVAEGLGLFPDDGVLDHVISNMPEILSAEGRRRWLSHQGSSK